MSEQQKALQALLERVINQQEPLGIEFNKMLCSAYEDHNKYRLFPDASEFTIVKMAG